jgi:vacuolar iron transporter family protein
MTVLVLGIANLVADGFAMAASNYSANKAERDDYRRILEIEGHHITAVPDGEREEVRQLFAAKGFAGDDLERLVRVVTRDPLLWAKTMAVEEYGLSPTPKSPTLAALSTFAAFILCGIVPLVTYLVFGGLGSCVIGTGGVFLCVGAIKSRWSSVSWWRSGFETLAVGMSAAALAFAIGYGLKTVFQSAAG